jgi:hypothetical protein
VPCEAASSQSVMCETASTESLMPVHRVPREALAASSSAEARMPRETMTASAAVAVPSRTVAGPGMTFSAACPAANVALAGPTVAAPTASRPTASVATVLARPAMLCVARKFKTLVAGKTLAAPALFRTATFATEPRLAEATLGKPAATETLASKATFSKTMLTALALGKLGTVARASGF